MLAEVRLVIAPTEARLTVRHGDDVVEDELWKFERMIERSQARGFAETLFADAYDLMQHITHGDE